MFSVSSSLFGIRSIEELIGWDRVNYQSDFVARKLFRGLLAVIHILSFFAFMGWWIFFGFAGRRLVVVAQEPFDAALTILIQSQTTCLSL